MQSKPDPAAVCFHCADPVPDNFDGCVEFDGQPRPVCCIGCEAVARLIIDSGQSDFYRHRQGAAPRPLTGLTVDTPIDQASHAAMARYDAPINQRGFVSNVPADPRTGAPAMKEARLLIDGVYCAACGWLVENSVARLDGVADVAVNPTTRLARIRYDESRTPLSGIFAGIAAVGYEPHPLLHGETVQAAQRERRTSLKRLAVAGLGMMQVMMFATAIYLGAFNGMDEALHAFLRGVSLLVATPVVFYAARPFFAGAWRNLAAGVAGMDVPVALAIGGAYSASVWATLFGPPDAEVYFDSVVMFTFFLSVGRYLEMAARHKAGAATEALARLVPRTALRVATAAGPCEETLVPADDLMAGDTVRVMAGDTVPADGTVTDGRTSADESLLTGESLPRPRGPGDRLIGGSVNLTAPVAMRVDRVGDETVLSHIARLLDRAQTERPRLARLADRVASYFVVGVLLIASSVALYWWATEPARAFSITLAVLVVTCPCALSLATPAAMTAATGALARCGLLITRGHSLETLAGADRIVFDKTGTLTRGRFSIDDIETTGRETDQRCLELAAALEGHSEHPVAAAFRSVTTSAIASDVRVVPGCGIEGLVEGRRMRIGKAAYVAALSNGREPADTAKPAGGVATNVFIGDETGFLARVRLADALRDGVRADVEKLRALGLEPSIASGDIAVAVGAAADAAGVADRDSGLEPEDKLRIIRALQADGHTVVMVGDGINDAPVLAAADMSVAMGSGAALAHASADVVLMGNRLAPLADGVRHGRRTLSVIRQNMAWAVGYNLVALPLAAAGMVAPWMAAIGMSLSSLVVVANALRVSRVRNGPPAGDDLAGDRRLARGVAT